MGELSTGAEPVFRGLRHRGCDDAVECLRQLGAKASDRRRRIDQMRMEDRVFRAVGVRR
jgi:hypothetical protein